MKSLKSRYWFACLLALLCVLSALCVTPIHAETHATGSGTFIPVSGQIEAEPAPATAPQTLFSDFAAGALSGTNWTVAPYATYAPNAPHKVGGGILAIYEVNKYLGAGLGIDYLGQLSMTSGNLELKLPITVFGKFTATPFALGGIAIPLGGAGNENGNAAVITGGGLSANVYKWDKGNISLGYAAVNWSGAGAYDGLHHSLFTAIHFHF